MARKYLKNLALLFLIMSGTVPSQATGAVLSLDSCRSMAMEKNKELRIRGKEIEAASYNRKSAHTAYLPKVGAKALYMHTGKELSLLSDEQKTTLRGIGDALSMPGLNAVGSSLVEALRTDTRDLAGAALTLTQPLYMGGKIKAYNNITKYAEQIAGDQYELQRQELLVEVDETYWQVIALTARRKAAVNYRDMLVALDNDISRMIAEGFATKADGLSVRVKINEADLALVQLDNGIEILKMKLCQLCGLSADSPVSLADESDEALMADTAAPMRETPTGTAMRPEMAALRKAALIMDEKVKIARSEFLPSVVLMGGYMASYPSVYDSFEKKFKGTWNIGVAVNIPILTWGDRRHKVQAAQAEAAIARLRLEETDEKIELQICQRRQKVRETYERYRVAMSGLDEADENLRHATLGMKEGVIPVINVLEAQTAWLAARTNLIDAGIGSRLAELYLDQALGAIK